MRAFINCITFEIILNLSKVMPDKLKINISQENPIT